MQHMPLDLIIQWTIRSKTRTLVHLYQPWPKLLINQNVKSQHLKAHRILQILRLTRPIQMTQIRLTHHHRLNNNVLNLLHEQVHISSLLRQDF